MGHEFFMYCTVYVKVSLLFPVFFVIDVSVDMVDIFIMVLNVLMMLMMLIFLL